MKSHPIWLISLLSMVVQACTTGGRIDRIGMSPILDRTMFESRIDSLRIIPLENDERYVLGNELELCRTDSSWIVIDNANRKIVRYAWDGTFLGSVGHRGKSAAEYLTVQNVQILKDTIIVYSFPGKVVRYSLDGRHINTDTLDNPGYQSFFNEGSYCTYSGYQQKGSYRMSVIRDGVIEKEYLKTMGHIMHFESFEPVFYQAGGRVIMTDSFNSSLYDITGNGCREYLSFDFGQYSIDKGFYRSKDEMESAKYLMDNVFARICRYLEADGMSCICASLDGQGKRGFIYGIQNDESWQWYQMGDPEENPFSGSLRLIENDCLVFIAESRRLNDICGRVKGKISGISPDCSNADYILVNAYIH